MWELYFGTQANQELIERFLSEQAARAKMVQMIGDMGFHPHYYRYVGEPNDYFIDFGSWSKFFFIKKVPNSED